MRRCDVVHHVNVAAGQNIAKVLIALAAFPCFLKALGKVPVVHVTDCQKFCLVVSVAVIDVRKSHHTDTYYGVCDCFAGRRITRPS